MFYIIASGLGSVKSPLNRIAGPMVCGGRELQIEADSSVFFQGEQTHQVTAYCVGQATNEKQDVSVELIVAINRLRIAAGFISSLITFGLVLLFLNWAARRLGKSFYELFQPGR